MGCCCLKRKLLQFSQFTAMKRPVYVKIWNGGQIVENFQIYDEQMETKSKNKCKAKFQTIDQPKDVFTSQTCGVNVEIKKSVKDENGPGSLVTASLVPAVTASVVPAADTFETTECEKDVTATTRIVDGKYFEGCNKENCCISELSEQNPLELNSTKEEKPSELQETFAPVSVSCPRCGHETDTETNLEKHWRKKHGKIGSRSRSEPHTPHCCNICGFETQVKRDLDTHSCVAVKCVLCDFESQSKQLLNKHRISSHKTQTGLVHCDICPYRSNRINNVENHKKNVHEGVRIVCQHCAKKFLQQSDFRRHLKDIHGEASPEKPQRKRPICQDCGYKTMMMSTLEKHKCVPMKCEKCDFETKNEAHLRRHKIKLHVKKDGMFCCDECPFKSLRDFNLKKHRENKHRNLKQYPKMTLK